MQGFRTSTNDVPACGRCGEPLVPGEPFCPGCGARVVALCRHCGDNVVPGEPFCPSCGTPRAGMDDAPTTSVALTAPPVGPTSQQTTLPAPLASHAPATASAPEVPMMASRRRSGRRAPLVAAFGGLVLVAGVAYGAAFALPWIFSSGFHTAELVPSSTFFYATVTLRPGLLQLNDAASVVKAFTSQPGLDAALQAGQSGMAVGGGVDVRRDILPLLNGEMSVAVYGNVLHPDTVLLAHSSDAVKLLDLVARLAGAPPPSESYRGATMSSNLTPSSMSAMAGAADRGWMVLGMGAPGFGDSGQMVVQSAVDRIEGGVSASLAADAGYRQVVDRLPGDKSGFIYGNSSVALGPLLSLGSMVIPSTLQPYLNRLSGRAALSLAAGNQALSLDWESVPDQAPAPSGVPVPGDVRAAFRAMPSDSLVAIGDGDAPALLSDASNTINSYLDQLGPHPSLQFTSWLGGEVALGIGRGTLQYGQTFFGNGMTGNPDVYLLAKVQDTGAAASTLALLDPALQPQTTVYSGIPLRKLPAVQNTGAAYGLVGNEFYAVYGDISHVLDARGGPGLQGNPRYQAVADNIDGQGFAVFIDLAGLRQLGEDLQNPAGVAEYDLKWRPFLTALRALGGSFHTDADGSAHGKLTLAVGT